VISLLRYPRCKLQIAAGLPVIIDSISLSSTKRQIWLKIAFKDIEKERAEEFALLRSSGGRIYGFERYFYMLVLYEVDCRNRQYGVSRMAKYDTMDNILSAIDVG